MAMTKQLIGLLVIGSLIITGQGLAQTGAVMIQTLRDLDDRGGAASEWLLHNPYTGEIQGMLLESGKIIDSAMLIPGAADWALEAVTGLDSDGAIEVITRNTITGALYGYFIEGLAVTSQGDILKSEERQRWTIKGFGDFNADAKTDILFFNQETGAFTICLMDGLKILTTFNLEAYGDAWRLAAVLDIDGDRMDDLIMLHTPSGFICAFRVNGKTLTSDIDLLHVSAKPYWTVVEAAIMGGKPALILENPSKGHVRACWFDDNGFGQTLDIYDDNPAWTLESVGDFDGDASDDMLFRHVDGWRYIITMDGFNIKGGFQLNVGAERLNRWRVTRIADFDDNGVDDIAMFDQGAGNVKILFLDGSGLQDAQNLYENKPGWYFPAMTQWADMIANTDSSRQSYALSESDLAFARDGDARPPDATRQSKTEHSSWVDRQDYGDTAMATSQSVQFFTDKNGVPRPIITTGMLGGRIDYHNLVIDRLYGFSNHGRWGSQHSPTILEVGAGKYAGDQNAYVYGVVAGLTNGTVEEWLNSRNRPGVSPWATLGLESLNTDRIPVMSLKILSGYYGMDPKKMLACIVGTGTNKVPYRGGLYYFDIDLGWQKLIEGFDEPFAFLSPGSFRHQWSPFFQKNALRDVVAVTKTLDHSKVIHWHDGEWKIIWEDNMSVTNLAVSRASSIDDLPKDIVISAGRFVIRFSCQSFGHYKEEFVGSSLQDIIKMDVDFDPNGNLRSYITADKNGSISTKINGKSKVAYIGHNYSSSSLWSQFNADGALRAALVGQLNGEVLCWSNKTERFFQLHPSLPWTPEPFLIYDMNVEAAVNVHGHIDENNVLRVVATWNKYATAPGWIGEAATWLMGTASSYAGPAGLFLDIPLFAIACLDYDYEAHAQYKETTLQLASN